ncbi:MAG TPA: site-2 protease family protein [Thiotrichales bacterium]|nr:site-2 protease family protein [Thiotrichales bacterium]
MEPLNDVQRLAALALPLLFAITVHETAHGWVALRLGDPTARMLGRLSLNPLRHIDPVGTLLVPTILFLLHGPLFGWAKPVPVTWQNLRHPRRDMALVAAAGPGANLLMALLWALVVKLAMGDLLPEGASRFLIYSGVAGIFLNVILMVLNLLPLLPLDGGRILSALLPAPWAYRFSRVEPYGIIILVALLVTGILGKVMWPLVILIQVPFIGISGVPGQAYMWILNSLFN